MFHSSCLVLAGAFLFLAPFSSAAVAVDSGTAARSRVLLGACTRDSLLQEPFSEWFVSQYEKYDPNPVVLAELRKVDADFEVTIFFGSWCGDSKREVPRFLKVLDEMSFPGQRVELVAVSGADSVKKQSPQGQEKGQEIYRVPTMIFKRDGKEINRIVEYPVESLERDVLRVLREQDYQPNYRSFPVLTRWLQQGLLSDENVSSKGLANQVRSLVSSEGELSAAGYVLLGRDQNQEAVKVFEMNVVLFPESAHRRIALARALHVVGEDEEAQRMLRRALELDDEHQRQEEILGLLEEVQLGQHAGNGREDAKER